MRWEAISNNKQMEIWEYIYEKLNFSPNINPKYVTLETKEPAFNLPRPYAIYNMRKIYTKFIKSRSWENRNPVLT